MKIKTECKKCGMCCKAITTNIRLQDSLDGIQNKIEDQHILEKYWTEISKEEAISINPILKDNDWAKFYYRCNALVDNKCSIHEKKPMVCRDFPMYNRKYIIDPRCDYSENCAFTVKDGEVLCDGCILTWNDATEFINRLKVYSGDMAELKELSELE